MTEAKWLACADPGPMLEFLRGQASDRNLRLFAVACCQRVWHLLADERSRQAVEMAEAFAEGRANAQERHITGRAAQAVSDEGFTRHVDCCWEEEASTAYSALAKEGIDVAERASHSAAGLVVNCALVAARLTDISAADNPEIAETVRMGERSAQAALLRDIFGPLPFRPVTIQPDVLAWNDRLVVRLARAIYEERRWGDMPILADALLDAGCDNEEMLSHAREQESVHVRGCWLLDLLLNKG